MWRQLVREAKARRISLTPSATASTRGSARAGLARSPGLDMCGVASPFCVAAAWPGSVVRRVAYTVQPWHRLARRQSQQLSLAEVQQLAAFVVRGRSMTGF